MPTLLLADDSITVQRVIALTFAKEQIRVVTVSDGTQAVERLKTLHPDIVLAGTVLPQVSGYDLAKHMRTIPGLRNVPVLLLTGAFETVDEEKLRASGATGILEKPVEPNNVIARVKELLGLKSEAKPATIGRLVTSADGPAENQRPVASPPHVATSTIVTPSKGQPLREQTGPGADTHSVDAASPRSADYLDTLDAAFDTLDQQLSGRVADEKPSRNPSGPLGQSSRAADPRSPGVGPQGGGGTPAPGNPVFEVDDDWFGDESQARADARAGRRQLQEDLRDPDLQTPRAEAPSPGAVFEVDDDWFAEDDKARAAKLEEHRVLAAEMGIHDVDLPHAEPVPHAPAPPSDLDFEFGLEDIKNLQGAPAPAEVAAATQPLHTPQVPHPPEAPEAPAAPVERPQSPAAQSPEVRIIAPEVTDEMLDQVAGRVAERLSSGRFGEQLMNAVTATVLDTVRDIASSTSERLVREIASEASERLSREIASETSERLSREIASETSERLSREIASATSERLSREIASATSERLSREIASETSERLGRQIASETSERLVREIASETSERLGREIASSTSERLVREIASESSERLSREIASEASERLSREIATETSQRLSREIAWETSERLSREIASEASERLSRDIATATSERLCREIATATSDRVSREIAAETSERLSREIASATSERLAREIASETSARIARDIVSETAERLVRDEIERIKSRARS